MQITSESLDCGTAHSIKLDIIWVILISVPQSKKHQWRWRPRSSNKLTSKLFHQKRCTFLNVWPMYQIFQVSQVTHWDHPSCQSIPVPLYPYPLVNSSPSALLSLPTFQRANVQHKSKVFRHSCIAWGVSQKHQTLHPLNFYDSYAHNESTTLAQ